MKKIFLFFFMFQFFLLKTLAATKIHVLKVYDGDSILASIDDNIFRIRLIGIDCFEGTKSKRAEQQATKHKIDIEEVVKRGNIAKNILTNKLKNQEVYFEFRGIDKYSRALGILYIKNNENINKEMLNSPYCKPYFYRQNPIK